MLNYDDLNIMKRTVIALFEAKNHGREPTDEEVKNFDNLYHKLKENKRRTVKDLLKEIESDFENARDVNDTIWYDDITTLYQQITFTIDEWLTENKCFD